MEWLRQRMEDHLDEWASPEPGEKDERFRRDIPDSMESDGIAALELVQQAVELIRGLEDRATNMEARTQVIVQQAIEELKLAERRVHSAEAQRGAALADIEEANVQVSEMGKALKRAESRLAANEVQLSGAELRANTAETRAGDAEQALMRIEGAIRIHLLGQGPRSPRNLAAAA